MSGFYNLTGCKKFVAGSLEVLLSWAGFEKDNVTMRGFPVFICNVFSTTVAVTVSNGYVSWDAI